MIDNLSARERIRGVYVVIVSDDNTKRLKDLPVAEGLLRLCYCLGKTADIKVIVNYVDDFGLLCRAFGASAFGAGHTLKERRAYPPPTMKRQMDGALGIRTSIRIPCLLTFCQTMA